MEHGFTEGLHWELTVLGRSVDYKNLSGAASHVRLSQPQLSRIIHKLESELGVVLLDRTARRKSGWTPEAHRLAETYRCSMRKLDDEIRKVVHDSEPKTLSVGALEGMIPLANDICFRVLQETSIETLELNVFDLNQLEENFMKGDLDLLFTSREPGRKKYVHIKNLGFQSLDPVGSDSALNVLSTYEANSQKGKPPGEKRIVSSSLMIRKEWMSKFKGRGRLPSVVFRKKQDVGARDVLMIGSDMIHKKIWDAVAAS